MRRRSSSRTTQPAHIRPNWVFFVPAVVLLLLFGLPVVALFWRAVGLDFWSQISSPSALAALRLSLQTSLASVAFALVVGTPLAYLLEYWEFRGRSVVELLVDLPVVLPPSVAGLALLIAFGRQGVFGQALFALGVSLPFTTLAVVIAQVFVSAPLFVRAARLGFASIDPQLDEATYVEGASHWQMFTLVALPLSWRALVSGMVLAWTRALGEFGATILFAGNLEGVTQTMPLAIYLGFERNLDEAVALSVLLVVVSGFLLAAMRKWGGAAAG